MKKILPYLMLLMLVAAPTHAATTYRYSDTVTTVRGDAVGGANVAVYLANTTTRATLYLTSSSDGSPKSNPTYTDGYGRYFFYVAPGLYDIVISGANVTTYTIEDVRVWSEYGLSYNVLDYGAVYGDTINDSVAIQAAIDAAQDGSTILFPAGTYYAGDIDVDGKRLVIQGDGASIVSNGESGVFVKTDHGNKLTVRGIWFSGSGGGVVHNSEPWLYAVVDMVVEDCHFSMSGGAYGLWMVGSRESVVSKCFFYNADGGSGIYLKDNVSTYVDNCVFIGGDYSGYAINYPGTGNGTDAGLVISQCEIMGWDYGVHVVGNDWLVITGSTIDFNTRSIVLGSQDSANIAQCYIGSITANPAIHVTSDTTAVSPDYSDKITFQNNTIVGHYEGGNTYDCILIDGDVTPNNISILDNSIGFYTRYGINFTTTGSIAISGNSFDERPTFGVAPIYNSTGSGDSSVRIVENRFNNATTIGDMNLLYATVRGNLGCPTDGRGTVTAGASLSYVDVTHGMGYTPALSDISITPNTSSCANKLPYVEGADATTFRVIFGITTVGGEVFSWKIYR